MSRLFFGENVIPDPESLLNRVQHRRFRMTWRARMTGVWDLG